MIAEARQIMALKLSSILSLRIAIRLNFFSLQKEILNKIPPFIDFQGYGNTFERCER